MNTEEAKKVLRLMLSQKVNKLYTDGKGHYFKEENLAILSADKRDKVSEITLDSAKQKALEKQGDVSLDESESTQANASGVEDERTEKE